MSSGEVKEDEFKFPDCWNDDIRMAALFAPFRSKSLNPTDYDSKMKFWTDLIESWCKHHKCPVTNISSLKNSFCRNRLHPTCLDDVFQYMNNKGILSLKDHVITSDQSWSWTVTNLILRPFQKTFNVIRDRISKPNENVINYIHLPTLKFLGDELIKKAEAREGLLSFKELMKLGYENPNDLSLVLHWLQNQGAVALHQENEETLVKIANSGQKSVKITQRDLLMYNLRDKEKILDESIKKLECERDKALRETKKHLTNKMKNMALLSLQRKKKIEKEMERRAIMLENIREIQHQINQVQLDSQVMDCYKQGVSALKEILKEKNISKETVAETMDELNAVLNLGNEIEDALAQSRDIFADESLEAELDELLLADAPEVPRDGLPLPVEEAPSTREGDSLETQMKALVI